MGDRRTQDLRQGPGSELQAEGERQKKVQDPRDAKSQPRPLAGREINVVERVGNIPRKEVVVLLQSRYEERELLVLECLVV